MEYPHKPVMVDEVISQLITSPDGIYVDATTGTGGHSEAILKELNVNGRLICVDRDRDALEITRGRLSMPGEERVSFKKANFSEMDEVLRELEIEPITTIIAPITLIRLSGSVSRTPGNAIKMIFMDKIVIRGIIAMIILTRDASR